MYWNEPAIGTNYKQVNEEEILCALLQFPLLHLFDE